MFGAKPVIVTVVFLLMIFAMFVIGPLFAYAMPMRHAVSSTAYCLRGTMADGTWTRPRSAASNTLRLGQRIRITSRQAGPGGMRRYVIRDRIGHGTQLDLWTDSCSRAIRYGRRTVTFKLGWRR